MNREARKHHTERRGVPTDKWYVPSVDMRSVGAGLAIYIYPKGRPER